jgi:hypothetical protein
MASARPISNAEFYAVSLALATERSTAMSSQPSFACRMHRCRVATALTWGVCSCAEGGSRECAECVLGGTDVSGGVCVHSQGPVSGQNVARAAALCACARCTWAVCDVAWCGLCTSAVFLNRSVEFANGAPPTRSSTHVSSRH